MFTFDSNLKSNTNCNTEISFINFVDIDPNAVLYYDPVRYTDTDVNDANDANDVNDVNDVNDIGDTVTIPPEFEDSLTNTDLVFINLDTDIILTEIETGTEPEHNLNTEPEPYMTAYNLYSSDFNSQIKPEIILSEESFRYTVYPIMYPTVWKNYKDQQKIHWVIEEIDMSNDRYDWDKKLSPMDRKFIMHVIAFFASFDGIVDENIRKNFIDMIKIKEAECAYGKQFDMENTHGEMYSLMLDIFIKDEKLKHKLINSIKTMECVKKKALWCKKWIHSDKTFAHKVIAFAIVEGVFFSGSFASIFWLKTRKGSIMSGLRKSNKFIARDEAKHVELACIIYDLLKNKLKESVVYDIMLEAVELEDEFITSSLPCNLLGMNSVLMSKYIRYVADRLLVRLGYNKKFHVTNPFEFMNKIDTFIKSNFFEERNDAYSDGKIDNPKIFKILDWF